jgi:3D (Asp-Asp-Asp) domain-containing protein
MSLAQSTTQKVFATFVVVGSIVLLYDVTIRDSRFLTDPLGLVTASDPTVPPVPGVPLTFSATAYCKGLVTSAGVAVQSGVIAADPSILPVGSVAQLSMNDPEHDGIYTVHDTGPEIKGREVDLYMWSCYEALAFGRKPASVTILRLGWSPHATAESFFDRIFRKTEPRPLPSRPLPIEPK